MTAKPRPIKSKVNSPLEIAKLFQFQKFVFPMFPMTVAATTVDI